MLILSLLFTCIPNYHFQKFCQQYHYASSCSVRCKSPPLKKKWGGGIFNLPPLHSKLPVNVWKYFNQFTLGFSCINYLQVFIRYAHLFLFLSLNCWIPDSPNSPPFPDLMNNKAELYNEEAYSSVDQCELGLFTMHAESCFWIRHPHRRIIFCVLRFPFCKKW